MLDRSSKFSNCDVDEPMVQAASRSRFRAHDSRRNRQQHPAILIGEVEQDIASIGHGGDDEFMVVVDELQ
jgi:hypothetical protein